VCIKLTPEDQQRQRLAEIRSTANFWVLIDGKERGPFSIEQLSQLLASERVSGDASVRTEGHDEIVTLKRLLAEGQS
jgi:hypothetical protein